MVFTRHKNTIWRCTGKFILPVSLSVFSKNYKVLKRYMAWKENSVHKTIWDFWAEKKTQLAAELETQNIILIPNIIKIKYQQEVVRWNECSKEWKIQTEDLIWKNKIK